MGEIVGGIGFTLGVATGDCVAGNTGEEDGDTVVGAIDGFRAVYDGDKVVGLVDCM